MQVSNACKGLNELSDKTKRVEEERVDGLLAQIVAVEDEASSSNEEVEEERVDRSVSSHCGARR
jgi:hypothetical protein